MTRRRIGSVVIALLLAALLVPTLAHWQAPVSSTMTPRAAFQAQREAVWVEGEGRVQRLLPDDDEGSRHQRFILALGDGQTLLIAHNIDLAPRLDGLARGDSVRFRGEYVWNARGGVVHWTHRDPRGERPGGWLEWSGRRYR
ncbi:DUF3465 domain-containing protein [Salinicola endophyticus]|uniref:DUF3465 domain-containing protein n=1 Tax=Salinicola endophyticus TaxID=1949083 RepID=A0AB74UBM3_9GAMM